MKNNHFSDCVGGQCSCEERVYYRVILVSLLIAAMEIVGGLWSGSLALLSDAAHVLFDGLAAGTAIVVAKLVKKSKFSIWPLRLVGAYVHSLLLFIAAVIIMKEAIGRLLNPGQIVTMTMLIIAGLGALGNWWQHRLLHHGEHNITRRGLALHIHSDMIQSLVVIVAGLAILITGFYWLDALASVAIGFAMVYWAGKLISTAQNNHVAN